MQEEEGAGVAGIADLADLVGREHPDPAQIVRVLAQVADALQRHEKRLDVLHERLLLVDTLPTSAPFGALLRLTTGTVVQRTPLYLGNGPGQPLSKLVPTPI